HCGVARQREIAQHVDLQLAEAAAERHLLGRRDVLVAEYQHVVVEVGAVQAAEIFRAERTRQVEADDFGAQRSADDGVDSKCLTRNIERHDGGGGMIVLTA
ncbi:hypothetical protein LTR94_034491, partial [Friedmanniomyces endolithicus]